MNQYSTNLLLIRLSFFVFCSLIYKLISCYIKKTESNSKYEIVHELSDIKINQKYTKPSQTIKNKYINELIYEYIHTTGSLHTPNDIRNQFNHFNTVNDIKSLKELIYKYHERTYTHHLLYTHTTK